jgi:hypothetical protein
MVGPILDKIPSVLMWRLDVLDFPDLSQSVRPNCWRVFS